MERNLAPLVVLLAVLLPVVIAIDRDYGATMSDTIINSSGDNTTNECPPEEICRVPPGDGNDCTCSNLD